MSKTIYTIDNYPNYRIVRNGDTYGAEKFNKFAFFKWWGTVYRCICERYYTPIQSNSLDVTMRLLKEHIHLNDDSVEKHENIKL